MIFVPIMTASFDGIHPSKTDQASAMINAARNTGSSIGVSIVSNALTHREQFHQSRLVEQVIPSSPQYQDTLQHVTNYFTANGSSLAQAHDFNAQQDCGGFTSLIEDFTGIQKHRALADAGEIMLNFIVFHGSLLRKDFSQQQAQLWNIPLTVSQVIQELAKGIVRFDFECQIEGLACGNDTKILIENNEGFSDRVHDSVSKFPSVLDVGELFSKHVETLAGAGSLPNSQSRCANLCRR
jgi:hypothetical protein